MSGGVRNLRAMFENKDQSTSPPQERGRSPGGSTGRSALWMIVIFADDELRGSKQWDLSKTPFQNTNELCDGGKEWSDGSAITERE